jgi:hypothetical protein
MSNEHKLDLNNFAATIKRRNEYGFVPLHKREAYFLWYALRSRSDEHATNLKRKLEKNGVLRHALYLRKQEVPYLLSLVSQTIEAAETQTHKIFNDYITCCGIDLLTVPRGQFVGQDELPSCAECRKGTLGVTANPPCETGTDTRGQGKAGTDNETTEARAETPAPAAAAPSANPYHGLARFLQEGGSEAYEKVLRALTEIGGEKQREESQQ